MKRLRLFIMLFTFLTLSINSMAQGKKQDNSVKKRVKQIFEYNNSQNWTALRTALADTMKMYLLSGAVIVKSPEALITFFKENRKKFPDEHSSIEDLITLGDKAIIKEKITGHHTQQPIYDVLIFKLTGNKIARSWIILEK